jgi:hypothetical protein
MLRMLIALVLQVQILKFVQSLVDATLRQKLVMRAGFDDPA